MTSPTQIGKTVIIGGDDRLRATTDYLVKSGVECTRLLNIDSDDAQQTVKTAQCVILPLPLTKDSITIFSGADCCGINIRQLLLLLNENQYVFAGAVGTAIKQCFEENGISLIDYFKDDALTAYNAVLTAQGLLRIVLENTEQSLSRRVLVTGYGNVGRAVARLFSACGAVVTVAARSEKNRAEAICDGLETVSFSMLKSRIFIYDIIINTVPAQVIDKSLVRSVRNDSLMLEAASAPYGIDGRAAQLYGKRLLMCPSLPGRFTPVSAGKIIADTVVRLYGEVAK